jgi:hypothetical protein
MGWAAWHSVLDRAGFARDIGLAHMQQRGMDGEAIAFHPHLGSQTGHRLECFEKSRATIGIA